MDPEYRKAFEAQRPLIEIAAAFATGKPPENITDSPDDGDEGQRLHNGFKGRDWKAVPRETLEENSPAFFNPTGLHYYLPAYMSAALEMPNQSIRNRAVAVLGPGPSTGLDYFHSRTASFTAAQREAIRTFLVAVHAAFPYELDESFPALADPSLWK